MRGSYRQPPRGNRLGALAAKDIITVTLELRRQQNLPSFGFAPELNPLATREERIAFGKKYGAGSADMKVVEDFARTHQFKVVEKSPEKRRVRVTGSVGKMEEVFHVKLSRYQATSGGPEFRGRQGAIFMPRELEKIVVSVEGLDKRPFARSHARLGRRAPISNPPAVFGDPGDPFSRGFTGQDLAALYHFPAGTTGKGQTIALIQLGGAIDEAEIARYFDEVGVLRDPDDLIVVHRPTRKLGEQPPADLEVALDVEVAGAAAPGAKIVVYFAEDTSHESFRNVVLDAIHDTEHCPNIISISWGGPESETTGQFRQSFHETLITARRFGITVLAAAGDYGSANHRFNDPGWDGHAHIDHPAADPLVLGCGGTELIRNANQANQFAEIVWCVGRNHGSGGGVSRVYGLPHYQQAVNVPAARNPRGPVRRGVPDVAGNASGESGYLILCNGQWFPDYTQGVPRVSGTSAVAPLWAALVARLNEALGADAKDAGRSAYPLGFLQPRLYAFPPGMGALTAITRGGNGDYEAGPGWNACAGLGVPDGERILEALRTFASGTGGYVRVELPEDCPIASLPFDPTLARRADSGSGSLGYSPRGGDPGGSNFTGGMQPRGGDPGGTNFSGAMQPRGGDPGGTNFTGDMQPRGGDPGGTNFTGGMQPRGGDPGGTNFSGALEPRGGDPGGSN